MAEDQKLQETKGTFKVVGKVIIPPEAYREGVSASGRSWRSFRFRVETSPSNQVAVEIMGAERDTVVAYSTKYKKSMKLDFDKRFSPPSGYHVLGTNMSLVADKSGNFPRETKIEYDAVPHIADNIDTGDCVVVTGNISYDKYESQNGTVNLNKHFNITNIQKLKEEIDFTSESFKEESNFTQSIVVVDTEVDEDAKVAVVSAYTIRYKGDVDEARFVIEEQQTPKMYKAFPSKMKFGDVVTIYGVIENRTLVQEVVSEEDEEDEFGSSPNTMKQMGNRFVNQMRITGIDKETWQQAVYTEKDFLPDEAETDYQNAQDPLGEMDDDLPF